MTALTAYSSRLGDTAEIAEFLAARLAERGIDTEVADVDSIESLDDYDAIVLGAPAFGDRWPVAASDFVTRFAADLAAQPFWLFSVGAGGAAPSVDTLRRALGLRGYRDFHDGFEHHADHRHRQPDWTAIDGWAGEIATALRPAVSADQSALG